MPNIPVSKKHKNFLFIIFIITVGLCAYSNSLTSEFVWDDELLILSNEHIKTLHNPAALLTTHIASGGGQKSNAYRPLQVFSYALNYAFAKLDVRAYHLTNLFLHVTVALLLYYLVQLLTKSKLSAFITAALFISHPIHTEAVSYISGRADPLVAVFILLTLILYVKYNTTKRIYFYALSILSAILALLSKEAAIVIPLILLSYDWIYQSKAKIAWVQQLPYLVLGLVYIILRKTVLNFEVSETVIDQYAFLERIPVVFQSFSLYLQKFLIPVNLHMEYEPVLPPMTDIFVISGMALILTASILFFILKRSKKLVSFCLGWILINFLPVSGIYPLNAFFAEHWSYVFSLGVFILVGWIAVKIISQNKAKMIVVSFFVMLALGININLTLKQNQYWKNAEKFYLKTLQYAPNSARVHFRLGLLYFRNGLVDQAIEQTEKAVEIDPNFVLAYENLILGYVMQGVYAKAIHLGEDAIKFAPESKMLHNNLGLAYAGAAFYDKAKLEFQQTIFLDPDYAKAYNNLGIAYVNTAETKEAIASFEKAIKLNPNYVAARRNLKKALELEKIID